MEKRGKKGQAAMEFLMTYGWAILAAIIAIGVLAYFGVFSPGKFMPSACVIGSPIGCEEYSMTTSGVTLMLRNGAGDVINIDGVAIKNCDETTDINVLAIPDGNLTKIDVTCTPTLVSGAKFKGDITITYNKTGSTINQQSTGTISGKVA